MYQTVYYKLLSVRYVVIDSGCLLFGQQFDWRGILSIKGVSPLPIGLPSTQSRLGSVQLQLQHYTGSSRQQCVVWLGVHHHFTPLWLWLWWGEGEEGDKQWSVISILHHQSSPVLTLWQSDCLTVWHPGELHTPARPGSPYKPGCKQTKRTEIENYDASVLLQGNCQLEAVTRCGSWLF